MRARTAVVVVGVAASLGLGACRRKAPSPEPATRPPARFELSGCAAVLAGRTCEVTPQVRGVRVWIAGATEPLHVRAVGEELAFERRDVQAGALLSFTLPDAAARAPVQVIVTAGAGERAVEARIEVRPAELDPRVAEAQGLRKSGKLAEAERALPDAASLPEAQRGRALGVAARLALAAGRVEIAASELSRAAEMNRASGRLSDAALDTFAQSFALMTALRRLPEARAALEKAAGLVKGWDDGRAHLAYYGALLASATGDVGAALSGFAEAEQAAERLGMASLRADSREMRATLLGEHGRYAEAAALFAAARRESPADAPACRRAELLVNAGWTELLAAEARDEAPASPTREQLAAAKRLYESDCPRPAEMQNVHVNLALDAVARGSWDEAAGHAAAARSAKIEAARPEIALWLLDVEARIALGRGDAARGLVAYGALLDRAREGDLAHAEWRALVGRGLALETLRRDDAAIEAYRAAEALLGQASLRVPLQEGRAAFLGDRARSARRLADLWLRKKRPAEALEVLRTSRARAVAAAQRPARIEALPAAARTRYEAALSRYLAHRDARDRLAAGEWQLAADRLSAAVEARRAEEREAAAALAEALAALSEQTQTPSFAGPEAGELFVLIDDRGAIVRAIAASASAVRSVEVTGAVPGEAKLAGGARLWEALSEELEGATRVTLSVDGAAAALDWHAAVWRGEPLVARRPVAYSAGLGTAAPRPREAANGPRMGADGAREATGGAREATGGPRTALVVADPGSDLSGALAEADAVSTLLREVYSVERLSGDGATRAAVTGALARAEWLHFAGHGRFDEASAWNSRLSLSGSDKLTMGDIVLLPRAPRGVVLSGCETGRAREVSHALDVSLAAGFLAAGAASVVATARTVDDELARRLSGALYTGMKDPEWSAPRGLARAQGELWRERPEADWAAYRVWVR